MPQDPVALAESVPAEYWEMSPEDAPIDVVHQWALEHPDASQINTVTYMPNVLFNKAHSTIRGLGEAVTEISGVLTTLEELSAHTYPEAIRLRRSIREALRKLNGALELVNAQLPPDKEHPALEPRNGVDPTDDDYWSQLGETRGD
jgi:hypothetical protein